MYENCSLWHAQYSGAVCTCPAYTKAEAQVKCEQALGVKDTPMWTLTVVQVAWPNPRIKGHP